MFQVSESDNSWHDLRLLLQRKWINTREDEGRIASLYIPLLLEYRDKENQPAIWCNIVSDPFVPLTVLYVWEPHSQTIASGGELLDWWDFGAKNMNVSWCWSCRNTENSAWTGCWLRHRRQHHKWESVQHKRQRGLWCIRHPVEYKVFSGHHDLSHKIRETHKMLQASPCKTHSCYGCLSSHKETNKKLVSLLALQEKRFQPQDPCHGRCDVLMLGHLHLSRAEGTPGTYWPDPPDTRPPWPRTSAGPHANRFHRTVHCYSVQGSGLNMTGLPRPH